VPVPIARLGDLAGNPGRNRVLLGESSRPPDVVASMTFPLWTHGTGDAYVRHETAYDLGVADHSGAAGVEAGQVVVSHDQVRADLTPRSRLAAGSVFADGQLDQRSLRLRHPDGLTLATVHIAYGPQTAVPTRGLQTLGAEITGVVGPDERREHHVAGLEPGHVCANVLRDAEELVADAPVRLSGARTYRLSGARPC
jgi:hypothetical protein